MELTYNELKKRDVINISDGRCLGRIIDIRLDFPDGILVGIVVPGRKVNGILKIFDRSQLYIDQSRIIKIGGDVILVDINCGDLCSAGVRVNKPYRNKKYCPPPCPPACPPNDHHVQPPNCPPKNSKNCKQDCDIDFGILSGNCDRIDTGDY